MALLQLQRARTSHPGKGQRAPPVSRGGRALHRGTPTPPGVRSELPPPVRSAPVRSGPARPRAPAPREGASAPGSAGARGRLRDAGAGCGMRGPAAGCVGRPRDRPRQRAAHPAAGRAGSSGAAAALRGAPRRVCAQLPGSRRRAGLLRK